MKTLLFLIATLSTSLPAEPLSKRYPVGEGSKFVLSLPEGVEAELMIYVADSEDRSLHVETFFTVPMLGQSISLWQQTRFESTGASIAAREAYLLTDGMKAPEKFNPLDVLPRSGSQWSDFLFPRMQAPGKKEIVQTEAGSVACERHQIKSGETTYDFWVSDQARPVGLVKLVATGKQPFEVKLRSLVSNVKRKIDPRTAVPLSATGKALLPSQRGLPVLP